MAKVDWISSMSIACVRASIRRFLEGLGRDISSQWKPTRTYLNLLEQWVIRMRILNESTFFVFLILVLGSRWSGWRGIERSIRESSRKQISHFIACLCKFSLFLTFYFNFHSLHKLKNQSVEICREQFKDFISACTSLKQITVLFVLNDHWIFIQAVN